MELRHLLVHLDSTERTRVRLELAVALAKRSGAVLTAVFAESAQLGPSVVALRNPARMESALAEVRAAFEAKVCSARLPNEWWQVERGDYAYVVGCTVACCRYSDLAIFGQYDPTEPRVPADMVEQVLLGSGRPVLVVPSRWSRAGVGTRVLVVWTGSREAARAVNDAIPLMEGAEEVTVLGLRHAGDKGAAFPPPLDIVAHLNAHGIAAGYEPSIRNGASPVGTLLSRAAQIDADLIVMGGSGSFPLLQQSRTTRELLRSMACPVLLAQ